MNNDKQLIIVIGIISSLCFYAIGFVFGSTIKSQSDYSRGLAEGKLEIYELKDAQEKVPPREPHSTLRIHRYHKPLEIDNEGYFQEE